MKIHLCVIAILCAFVIVKCEMEPEMKQKFDECREEFEMSEESLESPDFDDPQIKCFTACFLQKDDRITQGKLSIDKELEAAAKYIEKEKIDDSFKDKITECVNKANEEKDDCEVSGAMFKCVIDKFGPLQSLIEK